MVDTQRVTRAMSAVEETIHAAEKRLSMLITSVTKELQVSIDQVREEMKEMKMSDEAM